MAQTPQNSVPPDPYRNFRFRLEIAGITQAGFADVSGFGSSVEVIDYREGGDPTITKHPGKTSYPDIILKWGITDSRELYDWHKTALDGKVARKDGSIILLDVNYQEEKIRWNFFGAWPSKYDGPDFSAKGNDVAIETLTLSCERLVRA